MYSTDKLYLGVPDGSAGKSSREFLRLNLVSARFNLFLRHSSFLHTFLEVVAGGHALVLPRLILAHKNQPFFVCATSFYKLSKSRIVVGE